MNYQALRDEILTGPLAATLAPNVVLPSDPKQNAAPRDQIIADALNLESGVRITEKFVNIPELMAQLGAMTAASILEKIEAASLSNIALKWAMISVKSDRGIDVGNTETRSMLDQLVLDSVLTQAEADSIKALAEQPSSRSYESVGQPVTSRDVSVALRGDVNFTPV